MAQGGGKLPLLCQRGLECKDNYYQNKLATQPCPNDKWGKRIMNAEIKLSPSHTILGGWQSQSLSQGVDNNRLLK
jgi:hypothetical protein